MKQAYSLLRKLQNKFPTPYSMHHNLTFDPAGIRLSIYFRDKWYQFIVNGPDLEKPAEVLEKEISERILKEYR